VVALGVMAMQGLDTSDLGSASGLFSTVRNVGGAIGIALASQLVVERAKLHASRIGEAVTPFSEGLRHRMSDMGNWMSGHAVGRHAEMYEAGAAPYRQQVYALIDRTIHREALLLAYSDAFLVAGLAMLACAVGSMLLGRMKR